TNSGAAERWPQPRPARPHWERTPQRFGAVSGESPRSLRTETSYPPGKVRQETPQTDCVEMVEQCPDRRNWERRGHCYAKIQMRSRATDCFRSADRKST